MCLAKEKLGRPLFQLACRHHMHELVVESAFVAIFIFGASSGPDIALFKRFQSRWNVIDQNNFESMHAELSPEPEDLFFSCKEQVVLFCTQHLESVQSRDDCLELLELVIILNGSSPPRGVQFMRPGARWMARMIYAIKMHLFRNQFRMRTKELTGLKRFTAFTAGLAQGFIGN